MVLEQKGHMISPCCKVADQEVLISYEATQQVLNYFQ